MHLWGALKPSNSIKIYAVHCQRAPSGRRHAIEELTGRLQDAGWAILPTSCSNSFCWRKLEFSRCRTWHEGMKSDRSGVELVQGWGSFVAAPIMHCYKQARPLLACQDGDYAPFATVLA